jgi:hypothetical protein
VTETGSFRASSRQRATCRLRSIGVIVAMGGVPRAYSSVPAVWSSEEGLSGSGARWRVPGRVTTKPGFPTSHSSAANHHVSAAREEGPMSRVRRELHPELRLVSLAQPVVADGRISPPGATGMVVHVYPGSTLTRSSSSVCSTSWPRWKRLPSRNEWHAIAGRACGDGARSSCGTAAASVASAGSRGWTVPELPCRFGVT